MEHKTFEYNVSFQDFRFLQRYMARRIFAKNRGAYTRALLSVVLCAVFLTAAIVINLHPGMAVGFLGARYPLSVLLAIIMCLILAILSLFPAIKLRVATLRMQVSDDGPFLGATRLAIEEDGLLVERALVTSKYRWAALRGVELTANAVIIPVDTGLGLIIPASAFPSDAARYEFAADLSKKVESATHGAPAAPR